MRFTVNWLPEATEEYFELWLDVECREAVATSAATIDRTLAEGPSEAGESRPDNLRIIFEAPLAALYQVDMTNYRVNIVSIWYFKKRKG
jgi:hypothetical protein